MSRRLRLLKVFGLLFVLFFGTIVAGCIGGEEKTTTKTTTPTGGTETTTPSKVHTPSKVQQYEYTILGGSIGGGWYPLASAMADLFEKKIPGLKMTVKPGGALTNIIKIANNEAQFGFTKNFMLTLAKKDPKLIFPENTEPLPPEKLENIKVVSNLIPAPIYVIVDKKFFEKYNIEDKDNVLDYVFKNKIPVRIGTNPPGHSNYVLWQYMKNFYGITDDDIKSWGGTIYYIQHKDAIQLMKTGKLDIYFSSITGVPQSTVLEFASTVDVYFVNLAKTELGQYLKKELGLVEYTIPAGTYKGQDYPLETIAPVDIMIVNKDVPEDIIYQVTKIIYEDKDTLAATIKDMARLNPEFGVQVVWPMHPGAERYFREIGALK